ncbi:MAG: hypothetical protein ABI481_10240 [Pyrinomonadaceae bacterium]
MKKRNLMFAAIVIAVMLSVSAVFAQDPKMDMSKMPKGEMNMMEMHKDGHHMLMMAHQRNATSFARVLWDMTSDGKIENVETARAAFAEIMHCMEKMDEIHKMHMGGMAKMDAAMMEKMKPMMEKMQADKTVMNMHMMMLGKALQASVPDAQEVSMHAAWILLKLEKMNTPKMKMEMPGKMPM